MATYATLTVPVQDIIGADFNASRASVWIEPNVPFVLADSIRVGGRREQVVNGVATFANLVTTDTADNPASFGYRVTITAPPKGAAARKDIVNLTTADFPFTATADLTDISEAWDNVVLPVEWRSAFRDEMEALRDEAATITGLTGEDAAVALLVADEGSDTAAALSATYVRGGGASGLVLDVLTGSGAAVGDGTTDDTVALQAKIDAAAPWGGVVLLGEHAITASLSVPTGVTLRGRNDDSRLILPAAAAFPALDLDGTSRARVESLRVTAAGATASGAAAVRVRGAAVDITISNVTAEALYDGFTIEGADGTVPETVERVTFVGCHAGNSTQYGYRFGDVDGVDLIGCRSVVSGLDGIKLRKSVRNWTVTGGIFTGATGGDGLDAYAGGGDFTIQGGVFSGNALNGIVIKTDDLNLSDPANYGWVRNGNVANVRASNNGGSGITIHRNNGDVDDTSEPLVQSITVSGGTFNDNTNYGLFVNARQVSLVGAHAKRNGLDGIRVQSASRDVDLVACHVAGNSRTTSGARDGIWIAGKRVKVWGGSSIGSDPNGATNDADVTAGTKTQRYGIRIESTAAQCLVSGLSLRDNVTGDRNDQAADTAWIFNPSDGATSPMLIMPNNQRIFGRNAAGTALSIAYVTTGGGINIGDAAAGLSVLGASATVFPRLDTTASTTARASLRIPHGDAPNSPVNGDMWTTTAGLFVRVNGATVGPLS